MITKSAVEQKEIKKAALVLRAINHPVRQHVLNRLRENKKLTVTDLYCKLRLEQSAMSQHLAILREVGIVAVERAEKKRYYYIVEHRLQEITNYASALAHFL